MARLEATLYEDDQLRIYRSWDPDDPTAMAVTSTEYKPGSDEANRRLLADRTDQAIDTLQEAADRWDELDQAQRLAAMRLAIRVVVRTARLVLRRLERAD